MKIFFDLDGTLVDASDRLYNLFQALVPESTFSKNEYWLLKRNKINHNVILHRDLGYSNYQVIEFQRKWMDQIELPEWIRLDRPFENVTNYLEALKHIHELYVVTSRQYVDVAVNQLQSYGWSDLFNDILVTRQVVSKSEMIRKFSVVSTDWMVGDTGIDILEGKRSGLLTAGVLTGFLNRERLEEYKPEIIVNTVTDLAFNYN